MNSMKYILKCNLENKLCITYLALWTNALLVDFQFFSVSLWDVISWVIGQVHYNPRQIINLLNIGGEVARTMMFPQYVRSAFRDL